MTSRSVETTDPKELVAVGQLGRDITSIEGRVGQSLGGALWHFSLAALIARARPSLVSAAHMETWHTALSQLESAGADCSDVVPANTDLSFRIEYDEALNMTSISVDGSSSSFATRLSSRTLTQAEVHLTTMPIELVEQTYRSLDCIEAVSSMQVHSSVLSGQVEQFREWLWPGLTVYASLDEAEMLFGRSVEALSTGGAPLPCQLVATTPSQITIFEAGAWHTVRVPEVEASDPTGAGDVLAGAMAALSVQGWTLTAAARLAAPIAGICVTDWSSRALSRLLGIPGTASK